MALIPLTKDSKLLIFYFTDIEFCFQGMSSLYISLKFNVLLCLYCLGGTWRTQRKRTRIFVHGTGWWTPRETIKNQTRSHAIIYAIITPVTSSCKTALPATSCGWPTLLQTTEASAFSNVSTPTIHWIPTTFIRKLEVILSFPQPLFLVLLV